MLSSARLVAPVSAPFGRAVLDVEASLGGQAWRERLGEAAAPRALAIVQQHGLPDMLARVLAGRGIEAATALPFLQPRLRDALPDPLVLRDMEAAADRLATAVLAGERVAVFGDYDVDGACAAALLAGYLRGCGLDPIIRIPDRLLDGYGPSVPAVDALAEAGARLIVLVDCGTTGFGPLAHAAERGLDAVVLDHHGAETALPVARAVVNPNRQDDLSGLGQLCAAGVVFLTLVALGRALGRSGFWTGRTPPDLLAELDLVALATVADVVPLTGLNRAFVAQGLAVMRLRRRPGLAALADVSGVDGPPSAFHLGFLLGPRINAGGRIGDSALGTRLLLTPDPIEARTIADTLDRLNRERRAIEALAAEEAEAEAVRLVEEAGEDDAPVLVASGEGWHPGVVGLVASRLRERFGRPAIAVARVGAVGTGSGRSVPGVDLGAAVREAVAAGLLTKGGGHAMAAGLTIELARLDELRAFLAERCAGAVASARGGAFLPIDLVLTAAAATAATVEILGRAGPFGAGNAEPTVTFAHHAITAVTPVGTDHLRVATMAPDGSRLDAVAFRAASGPFGAALAAARGTTLHLAGTLALRRWGGDARAELRLLDAARPGRG